MCLQRPGHLSDYASSHRLLLTWRWSAPTAAERIHERRNGKRKVAAAGTKCDDATSDRRPRSPPPGTHVRERRTMSLAMLAAEAAILLVEPSPPSARAPTLRRALLYALRRFRAGAPPRSLRMVATGTPRRPLSRASLRSGPLAVRSIGSGPVQQEWFVGSLRRQRWLCPDGWTLQRRRRTRHRCSVSGVRGFEAQARGTGPRDRRHSKCFVVQVGEHRPIEAGAAQGSGTSR